MSAAATYDARAPFAERTTALPHLGLGISTEFEAGRTGLDVNALRAARPDLLSFLEVGCDLERGVDADARAWAARGDPVTYHFLDVNLEEPEDQDPAWVRDTAALARELGAAWLCGDAGLWHVGPRERGHGVLQPPVLEPSSADATGDATRALREATGLEVLPENPPAHVFLGRSHLLDHYARVAERADSGLLLDVAHLAVYQIVTGALPTDGLDGFPAERVVELHVAGGTRFEREGKSFVDDDHGLEVLPETWAILEALLPRVTNLRAVVVEAERNAQPGVVALFERVREALAGARS